MRRRGAVVPLERQKPLVERINFGIVRVYLDDIQEIFSILRELTDDVRIQADDYGATEPQDLLQIQPATISELTIVATQPSVTVTLSGKTATLEATDADTMTLGATKRIETRMRQCRRPLKRLLWTTNDKQPPTLVAFAFIVGLIALVLAIFAVADLVNPSPPSPDATTISWRSASEIWGLAVLLIALSVTLTARRQAIVIPRLQKDAPPFWERKRDDIAINAVFTVIGVGLGIVATLLVQSLGR
jgi:hypothetical protein